MKKMKWILLVLAVMMIFGGTFYVLAGQRRHPYETVMAENGGIEEETQILSKKEQTGNGPAGQKLQIPAEPGERAETSGFGQQAQSPADDLEKNERLVKRRTLIAFAGDVYLSEHVLGAYSRAGNQIGGVLDEGFRDKIAEADLFMANQEFPFSDRGTPAPDKQFTFRLPTEKVSMMQELNLDLVTLANNHALDYGKDALLDTLDTLDGAGIRHVGAGADLEEARQPVIMEVNGNKIAFLGATRVIPDYSWAAQKNSPGLFETYHSEPLLDEIRKVRELCDYVIVYVHWGIERETKPKDYQRTMGKQFLDAGADMVVGSHPHVLQGIEYYNGKPIVYSLGNFIFGSQIPKTALLMAELDDGKISLRLVPGASGAGYTHMLTEESKRQQFFREMQEISFHTVIDENGAVCEAE